MFKDATQQYWPLLCNVGGGTTAKPGGLHGLGCLLGPSLAVTARHVWYEIAHRYTWPVLLKHDGLHKCEIVHENEELDVLLLRAIERIKPCDDLPAPAKYPTISQTCPQLGQSVGFITRIDLKDPKTGDQRHTSFSHASVSMFLKSPTQPRRLFLLSGGIFQTGSSGGPVYAADGQLLGVIVETYQFSTDFDHPLPAIVTAPVIAPMCFFAKTIEELTK